MAGSSITQQLSASALFNKLDKKEKLYAHHMARASWYGARVIMNQVSPESESIFDLILELHRAFAGDSDALRKHCQLSEAEMEDWLEYSGLFLSNLGNYYGEGDQKFTPSMSPEALLRLGRASTESQRLLSQVGDKIMAAQPASLGYPGNETQSAYYPGDVYIQKEEVLAIANALSSRSVEPENTRIRKVIKDNRSEYEVLQASVETDSSSFRHDVGGAECDIHIVKGDHSAALRRVVQSLSMAAGYATSQKQKSVIEQYIKSFNTGSLESYRLSQQDWVTIIDPKVEDSFGFVETYRDPSGTRAEWQGLVAITDSVETATFKQFVDQADKFILSLPWTGGTSINHGKGPFEKEIFEPPSFASIHVIAYCSSIIFEGINLPNYNDIREKYGFKNVIIANKMAANAEAMKAGHLVAPHDAESYGRCRHRVRFVSTATHELIGHGTSRLLREDPKGHFNFDLSNKPINPVTGDLIGTWYKPGETYASVFGDIAASMEECRAMLVAAFLMDEPDLVAIFGYNNTSEVTADELLYNTYLDLGVEGVEGLQNYDTKNARWGQAHNQANFAILQQLLRRGHGCIKVQYDEETSAVTVKVDRSKILTDGKRALREMLLKLHIYKCTADRDRARSFYEDLTMVTAEHERWREAVLVRPQPRRKFVFGNTFIDGDNVVIKDYEATNHGLITSWAERGV